MKWGFPALWVAIVGVAIAANLQGGFERDPVFVLVPIVMLVVGVPMFRHYLWQLADSVDDYGLYLVAKRRGTEARIDLNNVMNVNSSSFQNPKTVVLRLIQPTALGNEISFIPKVPFTLNPFAKVEVVESLMERAYAARKNSV
jgi:hypothetical protein